MEVTIRFILFLFRTASVSLAQIHERAGGSLVWTAPNGIDVPG